MSGLECNYKQTITPGDMGVSQSYMSGDVLSFSTERVLPACPAGSFSPWAVAKTNTGVLLACSIMLGLSRQNEEPALFYELLPGFSSDNIK